MPPPLSRNATSDPSQEMVSFFVRRTNEHIDRVRRCLALMASVTQHGVELSERGRIHDASKFEMAERIPYIWLTEYHRCRNEGVPFTYPDGMVELVRAAINHHTTTNRHHAEFHADPNDMTEVDLIEMVCDWTAMSEEFGQDGGSARGWADKTIGKHLHFNADQAAFVYQTIDLLDSLRLTPEDHRF